MTFREEIVVLQARIADARAELAAWQASGMQEKYLEAYHRLDGLERELDSLRDEGVRATQRSERMSGSAGLMAELSIAYDGREYLYDVYRYDRLEDAVEYARLQRTRSGTHVAPPMPAAAPIEPPDREARELMAELGIDWRDGAFHLGPYRYTKLDDAVNYARLLRTQGRAAA